MAMVSAAGSQSEKGRQTPSCWAGILGDCAGRISREHYVSKAIFDGEQVVVRGFKWCRERYREIPLEGMASRILCKKHNEELSPVDQEVKNLRDALASWVDGDSRAARPGVTYKPLDGRLFSRWLCKTCCDLLATDGHVPPQEFVRFSFGSSGGRRIRTCLGALEGRKFDVLTNHVLGFSHYWTPDGKVLACFKLFGLPWVILNLEVGRDDRIPLPQDDVIIGRRTLMDQPRTLELQGRGTTVKIVITWPTVRKRRTR